MNKNPDFKSNHYKTNRIDFTQVTNPFNLPGPQLIPHLLYSVSVFNQNLHPRLHTNSEAIHLTNVMINRHFRAGFIHYFHCTRNFCDISPSSKLRNHTHINSRFIILSYFHHKISTEYFFPYCLLFLN